MLLLSSSAGRILESAVEGYKHTNFNLMGTTMHKVGMMAKALCQGSTQACFNTI